MAAIAVLLVASALGAAPRLAAQAADTSYFVLTDKGDTIAIERSVIAGQAMFGDWIQHQNGLYAHHYAMVLGADGQPKSFVFELYTERPHTYLLNLTWEPDSITVVTVVNDRATTRRLPASRAIPFTFESMGGLDFALRLARRARRDSTTVMQEPQHTPLGVRFFGADSASAGDYRMRVGADGRLVDFTSGTQEARRVRRLDIPALVARFRAADSAAAAGRRG